MDSSVLETYAGLEGQELLDPSSAIFAGGWRWCRRSARSRRCCCTWCPRSIAATPVIFLDTGKLFPETAAYRDKLVKDLGLKDVRTVRPAAADLFPADPEGTLHRHSPDLCCHVRKTLPLNGVAAGFDALISGRKRFHGGERARLEPLAVVDGRLKVEPLAHFSALDLAGYMAASNLPLHPLTARGYRSIGCMPCTTKAGTEDDPRAGRWEGRDKTECGIHWTANGRLIRVTRPMAESQRAAASPRRSAGAARVFVLGRVLASLAHASAPPMLTTRPPAASRSSGSWVTISTGSMRSRASLNTYWRNWPRSEGSSLENGSSSSSARGSDKSTRSSATLARWPPDRVAGSRLAKPVSPACASASSMRLCRSPPAPDLGRQRELEVAADREMRKQQVVLEQESRSCAGAPGWCRCAARSATLRRVASKSGSRMPET